MTERIPSAPASVARSVISTAWRVSLDPVEATTVVPAGRLGAGQLDRRRCSSVDSVGDSPVVPHTTMPVGPVGDQVAHEVDERLLVDGPAASKGVTMAVRTVPSDTRTGCPVGPWRVEPTPGLVGSGSGHRGSGPILEAEDPFVVSVSQRSLRVSLTRS